METKEELKKEQKRAANKAWREKNKEKLSEYNKAYQKKNKAKLNKARKQKYGVKVKKTEEEKKAHKKAYDKIYKEKFREKLRKARRQKYLEKTNKEETAKAKLKAARKIKKAKAIESRNLTREQYLDAKVAERKQLVENGTHKTCNKCGKLKRISEFYINKTASSGIRSQCKECDLMYRIANKKHIASQQALYKLEHAVQLREYSAEYRKKNEKLLADKSRAYRLAQKSLYHHEEEVDVKKQLRILKRNTQRAQLAVLSYIRLKIIVKPSKCDKCGSDCSMPHMHHHKGVEQENWYQVKWLCDKCWDEVNKD